uniref:Uncharacterized protein n=1 Tax=Arundo donax TaxID=35708 RepID=A0A0A8ZIE4_ARUDO
MHDTVSRL